MPELHAEVAVALDRTKTLMDWKEAHEERHREEAVALEERMHLHGKGIQAFNLFKANYDEEEKDRKKEDMARNKRIDSIEKKLDMFSVKFMIIWSGLGAILITLFKYILQLTIEGKLVTH